MIEPNLKRASAAYRVIRDRWVARGSALEAHERLSVITVAAGIRPFALLTQIDVENQSTVASCLIDIGLPCRQCLVPFDLKLEPEDISKPTIETYYKEQQSREPLCGLGLWSSPQMTVCGGLISLGTALSYPRCCELMDLRTKQRDHEMFLSAIVEAGGDSPITVEKTLSERREYAKSSYDHCHLWNRRFFKTHFAFLSSSTPLVTTAWRTIIALLLFLTANTNRFPAQCQRNCI